MGTRVAPLNTSKGCGGVMRAAPAGLVGHNTYDVFELGADLAALTHGHPSGYLAAGFLAHVIATLIDMPEGAQADIRGAVTRARTRLLREPGHEEVLGAVDAAQRLAETGRPTAEKVEQLGQGWVAEEALAIALYAALSHPLDFGEAVALAVNHSGDSDSTGAIAGNIVGASLGRDAIPHDWLEPLELRPEIALVASDLHRHFAMVPPPDEEEDWDRYPGW